MSITDVLAVVGVALGLLMLGPMYRRTKRRIYPVAGALLTAFSIYLWIGVALSTRCCAT